MSSKRPKSSKAARKQYRDTLQEIFEPGSEVYSKKWLTTIANDPEFWVQLVAVTTAKRWNHVRNVSKADFTDMSARFNEELVRDDEAAEKAIKIEQGAERHLFTLRVDLDGPGVGTGTCLLCDSNQGKLLKAQCQHDFHAICLKRRFTHLKANDALRGCAVLDCPTDLTTDFKDLVPTSDETNGTGPETGKTPPPNPDDQLGQDGATSKTPPPNPDDQLGQDAATSKTPPPNPAGQPGQNADDPKTPAPNPSGQLDKDAADPKTPTKKAHTDGESPEPTPPPPSPTPIPPAMPFLTDLEERILEPITSAKHQSLELIPSNHTPKVTKLSSTGSDLAVRRERVYSLMPTYELTRDIARSKIYSGKQFDDMALIGDLEFVFQDYAQWTVIQAFETLRRLYTRWSSGPVLPSDDAQETELSIIDMPQDKSILDTVNKLNAASSSTLDLRMLEMHQYIAVYNLSSGIKAKHGQSKYDVFVNAEQTRRGIPFTDAERSSEERRWQSIRDAGQKINQLSESFGLGIYLAMPQHLRAESFKNYTLSQCRLLNHCLRNGPDAGRFRLLCEFTAPIATSIIEHQPTDVNATHVADLASVLRYLSADLILPTHQISTSLEAGYDAIHYAVHFTELSPNTDTAMADKSISKQSILTLRTDEWLDDQIITELLAIYAKKKTKSQVCVLGSIALQFANSKLKMKDGMRWVAAIDAEVILSVTSFNSAHWMVVVIDNVKERVRVLDSLNVQSQCRVVATAIRQLMLDSGKGEYTWTFERSAEQQNGNDCGVLALLNIIWMMHGPQYKLPPTSTINTEYARRMFCVEVLSAMRLG